MATHRTPSSGVNLRLFNNLYAPRRLWRESKDEGFGWIHLTSWPFCFEFKGIHALNSQQQIDHSMRM